MNDQMLELLIGKYLDSEITPAEQRLLDDHLSKDPAARQLLQEYSQLHDNTRQVLQSQVLDQGASAGEIISDALAERGGRRYVLKISARRYLQVATGLAAGLLLGFLIYGVWISGSSTSRETSDINPGPALVNNNLRVENSNKQPVNNNPDSPRKIVELNPLPQNKLSQGVDYFNYMDSSGTQYIVEAYRDNDLQAASYNGGL
jgi:hypothetical protein